MKRALICGAVVLNIASFSEAEAASAQREQLEKVREARRALAICRAQYEIPRILAVKVAYKDKIEAQKKLAEMKEAVQNGAKEACASHNKKLQMEATKGIMQGLSVEEMVKGSEEEGLKIYKQFMKIMLDKIKEKQ
ncbi:hypothetical protein [Magnetofaba australis]|uniref:Uncharacterized protein n=1 Tax=Magnetofaba australis IT-1 TaxID=1434232 RepID=A0A1Y2K890_9PROT|nr:hypothetical protein [Magnetofaba australis]OSM06970.1 hypothetical protein MAIT1_00135 [Magnetofaba australis IT-1]